jgi:hypothetical protein
MSVNDRRRAFFDGLFQKIENITPKTKFLLKKKFLMNSSGLKMHQKKKSNGWRNKYVIIFVVRFTEAFNIYFIIRK